ncbi:MAG: response regulator [Alphaproteobacteria bacterium]|nr:MAG: response regulator [Alphaproteobacteria bacterium]
MAERHPAEQQADTDQLPHILVVDDDRRIRSLLKKYLMDNGFRITVAADAAEARAFLEGLTFDLIVLDIMMPGESGLELTSSLREISEVPILLLTARGTTENRIEGLESGADDYLMKPFEPRELVLRVRSILRRSQEPILEQPKDISLGECRFNSERGELWRGDKQIKLTSAEQTLLHVFAASPGETFSRADLAEKTGVAQERSIDVQVTRLRRKIENDPKMPLYLQTVRSVGYVLIPD